MGGEILQWTPIEELQQFTLVVTTKEDELPIVEFGRVSQGFEHHPTMRPPIHVVTQQYQRLTPRTGYCQQCLQRRHLTVDVACNNRRCIEFHAYEGGSVKRE